MAGTRKPARKSPAADVQPAAPVRVRVTFVRAHQHRNVAYAHGDTYQATPAERDLLRHFDAIEAD